MRGVLVTLSSLALVCSSLTLSAPARAATGGAASEPAKAQPAEDPRVLYDEGRKAYRLGDYEAAVQKWERAYALSDKPLLLYNISLAYKGRYTITKNISDLRRAKAILENFVTLAEADPDLGLDDAPERMKELEAMIAQAEEEEAAGVEPTPPPPQLTGDEELRDMPEGPDPGRKLRVGGIAAMGTGGGLVLVGAGVGIFFLIRSQQFTRELNDANDAITNNNCPQEDQIPPMPDDQLQRDCLQFYENANTARDNGNEANVAGYISVGVLGGLGLVGLITGAVLFTEGNRRSRRWEKGITSHLRVMPTTRGLLVSGRF